LLSTTNAADPSNRGKISPLFFPALTVHACQSLHLLSLGAAFSFLPKA